MQIRDLKLPELEYSYASLVPAISEVTMQTHHTKHHQAYLNKLLECVSEDNSLGEKELESVIKNLDSVPESIRKKVQNNGGGFYNHTLFFGILTDKKMHPSQNLLQKFSENFGSFDEFKEKFVTAGLSVFGSGWVWLVNSEGGLNIATTPNQDNPLMKHVGVSGRIIFGIDAWEHAYYLDYKQDRKQYLENIFTVLNYEKIENNLLS